MNNDLDLSEKVVVITGGANGAGTGISEVFRNAGAKVIVTYCHNKVEVENSYYFDQSDIASIRPFFEMIKNKYGRLDVVVNNAGIYPAVKIEDINEKDFDEMNDTNNKAIFFINQIAGSLMQANGGCIINISSINATNPSTTLAHYGASKAAVEFTTKAMAYNYGPKVRVNCIAPGLIYKKGQEQWIPTWVESYSARAALKRVVLPSEIGKVALFLASDLSSAITGQILTVDCGISLSPCFDNTLRL